MMGMESGNKTAQKIRSVKFNLIMNAILTLVLFFLLLHFRMFLEFCYLKGPEKLISQHRSYHIFPCLRH